MIQLIKYYILNIVTVFTVTMFFSCKDNYNEVQKIGVSENEPIGEAEDFNLKYTDSGKVTRHLVGAKMRNYSNRDFPYYEFPEGITLYIYDDDKKSTIVSDYAIVYDKTSIIDLQGNVVISTHDGNILKTEQLYFDRKKEWLFSNNFIEISGEDGSLIKGNVFDANGDFTFLNIYETHDSFMEVEE